MRQCEVCTDMKDKITRLSKGITDIEAPAMRIIPELFCEPVYSGKVNRFSLELASDNNTSVKGICFADNPRISIEPKAFAGRRVHLTAVLDVSGLCKGDKLEGKLALVTNGGEYYIPYEFNVNESVSERLTADFRFNAAADAAIGADGAEGLINNVEAGLHSDNISDADGVNQESLIRNPINFASAPGIFGKAYGTEEEDREDPYSRQQYREQQYREQQGRNPQDKKKQDRGSSQLSENEAAAEQEEELSFDSPEDKEALEEEISELIRSGDTSPYAFGMYGEAIRHGININGIYESYIRAFPADCKEEMPKEVFIYFSYESGADHGILKKLYCNILQHKERDSEIYMHYERAMSSFAISNALKLMMDDELAVIYDRMIYPDIIDERAAAVLPDIFKCCRIETKDGRADYLTVSYDGLEAAVRADISGNVCFVPVYFKDARLRFFAFGGQNGVRELTEDISYELKSVFERPDIMRRCFELDPQHEMLLLSAAREISERGLKSEDEVNVVLRTFKELRISPKLRRALLGRLCDYGSPKLWLEEAAEDKDYGSPVGRRLFAYVCNEPEYDLKKALGLIRSCGADKLNVKDVAAIVSRCIEKGQIPREDGEGISAYFISLAKYVFDNKAADKITERFLAKEYEGDSESMYALMLGLMKHGIDLLELPEKILTVKLFTGCREHIDECFEIYVNKCEYTQLLVKAYLSSRCADAFLHEEPVADSMYEALRSYVKAAPEPLNLPLIYRLALTSYYADIDELDEEETKLLKLLGDDLIAMGLVFRYTKKLRKKIHIPDDICSRFYVQFNATGNDRPRLLTRILPDNEEYRATDMQRVYKNIYIMSTVLFKGDELQYIIYNNEHDENAAAEGIISVKKYHRQRDAVFASLDTMTRAVEDRDIGLLKETMLEYAERTETVKLLFDLEK